MSGRSPTAQEAALASLREAIATRELLPGQQIVQERLSEQLGISRVPLREALKVLEGEGQVVYAPHRGYFVAELSFDDLIEVYRIRDLLESEAVRIGVPAISDAQLQRIDDLAHAWEQAAAANDLAGMTTANRAMHLELVASSGLPRLVRMVRVLWDASDAYRAAYYSEARSVSTVQREHRAIIAAVRRRDAEAVVVQLREHRDRAVKRLGEVLAASDG